MIAYIEGKLTFKSPATVHMDVQGLGYEVQISLNTFSRIRDLDRCRLFTFLHIKEDAHTLYGFFDQAEKSVFLQLISVSGVGASTARMMLSSLQPEEIQAAILQENERTLESIKGIGSKTARRLILELKDKFMRQKDENQISGLPNNTMQGDALNALIALGISRSAADSAVQKVLKGSPPFHGLEELIKQALKNL
ncbi:MAG TPA: Holliday junction branch migration protein RuvA [Chitinophagaceae bacterium]|nr:Holliday junction branch migration protein RuvA [Chitinophagaceae bacterium]